jgi:hypothetical protein
LLRATLVVLMVVVVAGFGSAAARADSGVLPPDAALPWASPNHDSPLEQLLDPVVTQAIGQPAAMHCAGDYEWAQLSAQTNLPSTVWGYVEFWGGSPLGFAEVSPQACRYLQTFAQANPKPTKCAPLTTVYVDRTVTTYHMVVVRVKRNGRLISTIVRRASHTIETVGQQSPGSPVPCFSSNGRAAMALPQSYWTDYSNYAMALLTIGHEPFHIAGDMDEARVNCHGLQRISMIAQALGDTPDDSEQIARYVQKYVIPSQPPQYQLPAECRDGGTLDLNPGSSTWP